ncbi:MAG TPA: zf-HC2 domain-containing protein [Bryobacteraceae bacterium]|nr:zf-HC2 domain-containing protein [Bryobacteraceae bacterium]
MKANNYEDSHPADAQLLLALDGELESGEAASVLRHMENCPVCHAQWERWTRISERIADYHHGALQARVPPTSVALPRMEARSRRSPARARLIAALSGAAAVLVCLAWFVARADRPAPIEQQPIAPAPLVSTVAPQSPEPQAVRQRRPHRRSNNMAATDNTGFLALPFSDDALPIRDATVVRVELPVEELWLSGLAVEGGNRATMVQADVLLGIDGLPRGIRIVQ